ncbi:MAG TPA: hypothetical protein VJV78_20535 [Polyangiales bacterium]|nr:hypothetical protein [Polyangiales bacterium]
MHVFPDVKILDARFHPRSCRSEGSLVLARVYCERGTTQVEAVHSALENTGPMVKLRCLVEQAGPHTFESLLSLHSDHWTFAVCRAAR